MQKIVAIAGSDTSGGAGIEADLRTYAKHDLYGTIALTCIVTMDPHHGWKHAVAPIPVDVIRAQLTTAFDGLELDGVKTGMLPTPEIIDLVAEYLDRVYDKLPIVIDPVMVCKGDEPLFPEHAAKIRDTLVRYATVATPNLFEAAQLARMKPLRSYDDACQAAHLIFDASHCQALVIKGVGGLMEPLTGSDLFYDGKDLVLIEGEHVDTTFVHGLGCTFASHVASFLVKGMAPLEACRATKSMIHAGLIKGFALNQFVGTLNFAESFA